MLITILLPIIYLIFIRVFQSNRKATCDNMLFMSMEYTNIVRGIATMFVVLMHTSCNAGQRVFTPLGGIGVALFLILSGYGLTISYKKNGIDNF